MNEVGLPSRWTKHHLLLHTSGLFFPSWFLIPEINKSNVCQLKKNYFNTVNYFIFSLYSSLFNFHVLIPVPCLFRGKMVMKKKFFKTLKKITYLFIFIFGCAGSPLLRVESEGCSSLRRRGPGASRGEQALSVQASAGVSLEHRLTGLAALWHVGSSWTWDWTHVSGTGSQILYQLVTTEAQENNS